MGSPFLKARKLWKISLLGACATFCACLAHADEEIRLAQPGSTPVADRLEITASPGERINLEAYAFEDDEELDDVALNWKPLDLSPDALSLIEGGRGRSLILPTTPFRQIRIQISDDDSGAKAVVIVKNKDAPAEAEGPKHSRSTAPSDSSGAPEPAGVHHHNKGWQPKGGRDKQDAPDAPPAAPAAPSASQSYEGESMESGSGASVAPLHGHSKASSPAAIDRAFDQYYSEMPYPDGWSSGGAAHPDSKTPQTAEVAVVSCSQEKGPGGALRIVCEDPAKKVLRISPRIVAKTKAVKKNLPAKKPLLAMKPNPAPKKAPKLRVLAAASRVTR